MKAGIDRSHEIQLDRSLGAAIQDRLNKQRLLLFEGCVTLMSGPRGVRLRVIVMGFPNTELCCSRRRRRVRPATSSQISLHGFNIPLHFPRRTQSQHTTRPLPTPSSKTAQRTRLLPIRNRFVPQSNLMLSGATEMIDEVIPEHLPRHTSFLLHPLRSFLQVLR